MSREKREHHRTLAFPALHTHHPPIRVTRPAQPLAALPHWLPAPTPTRPHGRMVLRLTPGLNEDCHTEDEASQVLLAVIHGNAPRWGSEEGRRRIKKCRPSKACKDGRKPTRGAPSPSNTGSHPSHFYITKPAARPPGRRPRLLAVLFNPYAADSEKKQLPPPSPPSNAVSGKHRHT